MRFLQVILCAVKSLGQSAGGLARDRDRAWCARERDGGGTSARAHGCACVSVWDSVCLCATVNEEEQPWIVGC